MAALLTVNENGLLVTFAPENTTNYSRLGTSGFATNLAGFTNSWQGTNLSYSDGLISPVGGNLNRVTTTKNGTLIWDLNGFTVPINGAIGFEEYILKVIEQGTVLNVYGGRGNDIVTAFATTKVVDGFGGIDTMLLGGPLSVFTADNFSDGTLVLAVPGESVSTLVKNVEYFEFTDQTLSYSELESLYSPPLATFRLSASTALVNEGSTATFTLSTTNVVAGTAVAYTISGVSSADIVGGVMSGTVTVGTNGQAMISVPILADNLTEGPETMTVTVRSPQGAEVASANVTISDTSTASEKSTRVREFTASSGDEVFQGSNDKIDVVIQAGNLTNFRIQKVGDTVVLTDNSGSGGTDTLVGIERVTFSDKAIAFDFNGATSAGGIYRLYKATFNREPDTGGLGYWIGEADAEMKDAVRVAEDFIWSKEFQQLYGITTQDNYGTGTNVRTLVTGFYENVLGRTPDQGGLDYYTGVIETREKTVGRVLAEISDSQENYDGTIELIANGIVFDPWVG
jgi:hypothetical protein